MVPNETLTDKILLDLLRLGFLRISLSLTVLVPLIANYELGETENLNRDSLGRFVYFERYPALGFSLLEPFENLIEGFGIRRNASCSDDWPEEV